jgi:hypothetical protein
VVWLLTRKSSYKYQSTHRMPFFTAGNTRRGLCLTAHPTGPHGTRAARGQNAGAACGAVAAGAAVASVGAHAECTEKAHAGKGDLHVAGRQAGDGGGGRDGHAAAPAPPRGRRAGPAAPRAAGPLLSPPRTDELRPSAPAPGGWGARAMVRPAVRAWRSSMAAATGSAAQSEPAPHPPGLIIPIHPSTSHHELSDARTQLACIPLCTRGTPLWQRGLSAARWEAVPAGPATTPGALGQGEEHVLRRERRPQKVGVGGRARGGNKGERKNRALDYGAHRAVPGPRLRRDDGGTARELKGGGYEVHSDGCRPGCGRVTTRPRQRSNNNNNNKQQPGLPPWLAGT